MTSYEKAIQEASEKQQVYFAKVKQAECWNRLRDRMFSGVDPEALLMRLVELARESGVYDTAALLSAVQNGIAAQSAFLDQEMIRARPH